MQELMLPIPNGSVLVKNTKGFKSTINRYRPLLKKLIEKFPMSIKLLELYGTLLSDILL
jgi:hypothetical protein